MQNHKKISIIESLVPIMFLIVFLTCNVLLFEDTLEGSNQIILLLAATVAAIISIRKGISWASIQESIVNTIGTALPAILILLLIGSLSGTWLLSGVIPMLIYYGLDVLHPAFFLFAAVIISSLISLTTGSSWSTIATIGVALLGIGLAMGLKRPVIAGAIISGAYFGDKMSPLSDTTNLAPAMAGTDLFTHIRYMLYTTVPALIIALIIFLVLGLTNDIGAYKEQVTEIQQAIKQSFHLSPFLFFVPVLLIVIIVKKVPPIPSLLAGVLLGGIFAVIFQPQVISLIADNQSGNYAVNSYIAVLKSMYGNVDIQTNNKVINELFSTSGMSGMLSTIWLILSAMVFGGVMEAGGLLAKITNTLIQRVKSSGSLIASTVFSCIFFNATASDPYIAIVVPGRMFKQAYKNLGLKPEVLSRTLEDSGTVTSVLIPWNTGGATQSRVLGVPTIEYLPYCFFNYISPLVSIAIAYLNFKIRRTNTEINKN